MNPLSGLRTVVEYLLTAAEILFAGPFSVIYELARMPPLGRSNFEMLGLRLFGSDIARQSKDPEERLQALQTFRSGEEACMSGDYHRADAIWSELANRYENSPIIHNNLALVALELAQREEDSNRRTQLTSRVKVEFEKTVELLQLKADQFSLYERGQIREVVKKNYQLARQWIADQRASA